MAYPSNAIHGCPHKQKPVIAIALHITYDDELYRMTHKKRKNQ